MRSDYTHITVILDRSGSMESIRNDTIGGFNSFLTAQKAESDFATLTLVQFDTQDAYEVIQDFRNIQEVPELTRQTFVPRAGTPLYDSMGKAINDLEQKLATMPEATRPQRVIVAFVTDGQENSSCEFSKSTVQKMIKEKQEKSDWQFVFLSADLAAMDEALAAGVAATSAMLFDKTSRGIAGAWGALSSSIGLYRSNKVSDVTFTEKDRAGQEIEKNKKNRH
ncbi:MAG TPA: VWA domain-containing protein [Candidatus Riflebacteria bacterium]|nr:VWA domain-containing protein [Candidatus Riflebacteria bacterium]